MSIDLNSISLPARLLGAFFYYSPESATIKPLVTPLLQIDTLFAWRQADIIKEQCLVISDALSNPELSYQHSVLFEGQGPMVAPPWGSVYLDSENLLMGESTENYRHFLTQQQVVLNTGINEPEDQFGLMLMALALLLESNQLTAAKTLISDHLMSWALRYLSLLEENEVSTFYRALSIIAQHYLQQLVNELQLHIPDYHIYR